MTKRTRCMTVKLGAYIACVVVFSLFTGNAYGAAPKIGFLQVGDLISAPRGFVDMCRAQRAPMLCPLNNSDQRSSSGSENSVLKSGFNLGLAVSQTNFATGGICPGAARSLGGCGPTVSVEAANEPAVPGESEAKAPLRRQHDSSNSLASRWAGDGKASKILTKINVHVNSIVSQQSDTEVYGVDEMWAPSGDRPGARGDCEDIAIEKRIELIHAGFPAERLAFAVVFSQESGLHTVLVAHMDKRDLVLDSRSPWVVPWNVAPYTWLALQSYDNPMLWRAVRLS